MSAVTRMVLRLWSDQEGLARHLQDVEAMTRTTVVRPVKKWWQSFSTQGEVTQSGFVHTP